MMVYMAWDGSLGIGHALVDDDHRTLVACVNDVYDAAPDDTETVNQVLDRLGSYTVDHFSREQDLMASCRFPLLLAHSKEHALLVKLYHEYRDKYRAGEATRDELLKFLKLWLAGHIMTADVKLAAHLQGQPLVPVASERVDVDWSRLVFGIVDDSSELCRLLRTMLRGLGCSTVFETPNGTEFLKDPQTLGTGYSILLIDDEMAPVDGIELMHTIRSHSALSCHKTVAILMAGDGNVGTLRAALEAGYHGVLVKPFSANALRQQVERFIAQPLAWEKDGEVMRPVHPKKSAAVGRS
jgi:hemerythrin